MYLYLVAGKPTDSVRHGFIPAAGRLGLAVKILTDRPTLFERALGEGEPVAGAWPSSVRDSTPGNTAPGDGTRPEVVGCDVFDVRALIAALDAMPPAEAVFSNSDHLQAQTALAADYFNLPGKDWRSALRAKNKALMRRHLARSGVERVATLELPPAGPGGPVLPEAVEQARFPLVVKPREGVASEDVKLVGDRDELAACYAEASSRRPGETFVAEEYLPGGLRTVETLGDATRVWAFGGFRTTLSPPPFFIEERLDWDPDAPEPRRHALAALSALGAGFGACHTELSVHPRWGTRVVEVNDRVIGDHCDFVLADLLRTPLFETIIRVHLGEPLPDSMPRPCGHAAVDYVLADRDGRLRNAPPPVDTELDGSVRLVYRPLRARGDQIAVTHTNRDYLGVIRAVGPDADAVDRAVVSFRAGHRWEIAS